jgi:transketolase
VDYDENRLDQWFRKILTLEPVEARLRSLNWHTTTVDGHDLRQVLDALHEARKTRGQPTCIIAHTVHGKGVSFLESSGAVPRTAPTPELVKQALEELEREAAAIG